MFDRVLNAILEMHNNSLKCVFLRVLAEGCGAAKMVRIFFPLYCGGVGTKSNFHILLGPFMFVENQFLNTSNQPSN